MLETSKNEIKAFILDTYGDFGEADLKEFLALLAESAFPDFRQLEGSLMAGNLKAAFDAAHRTRNFTLAVGAMKLSAELQSIEVALRAGERGDTEARLESIRADYLELAQVVATLASSQPANR